MNNSRKPGLFVCKYKSVFILTYSGMFMGYKVVKWCMNLNICSDHWFAVEIQQSSSVACYCTCECTLYSEVFIKINKCWYHVPQLYFLFSSVFCMSEAKSNTHTHTHRKFALVPEHLVWDTLTYLFSRETSAGISYWLCFQSFNCTIMYHLKLLDYWSWKA